MVRKRLITVLTLNDGVLYRTRNFVPDYRYTLNFADAWDVDEVVLLDITRPGEGNRSHFYDAVKSFANTCFVPLSVGGGVRSTDDFRLLLRLGADKIILNSQAVATPELITEASHLFGSQCVVVCVDVRRALDGSYAAWTSCGANPVGVPLQAWVREIEARGAGEILIQSIDKDGTLEGYDNTLNQLVSDAVNIPVLACGGAGRWQHFVDAFKKAHVSGVCTSNIYHFTAKSIQNAKAYIHRHGIDVRV